jgi:hypothetical protein
MFRDRPISYNIANVYIHLSRFEGKLFHLHADDNKSRPFDMKFALRQTLICERWTELATLATQVSWVRAS